MGITEEKIGWGELEITDKYVPGIYKIKAELRSLEDIEINKELKYEKGEKIYIVSRSFYVGIDPEAKGLFEDIIPIKKSDKDRYIWVEETNEGAILYYNLLHPIIKELQEKDRMEEIKELCIREGLIFLLQMRFSEDLSLLEQKQKSIFFKEKDLKETSLETIINVLLKNRSILLWEKGK